MNHMNDMSNNRTLLETGGVFSLWLDAAGNLVLVLTDEYKNNRSDIDVIDLHDAAEPILCNSEWELMNAEDLGWLSSAPVFLDWVEWDEDHLVVLETGRAWYYDMYAIFDPLEQLILHGEVTFNKVPD